MNWGLVRAEGPVVSVDGRMNENSSFGDKLRLVAIGPIHHRSLGFGHCEGL